MGKTDESLIIAIVTMVVLITILVTFFIIFQKRKNKLIIEKKNAEKFFLNELSNAQIEIREETFRNISWELHDNIGQLLTLAKIQLQSDTEKNDINKTLNDCLSEVRQISKAINPEIIAKLNLVESLEQEIERYNKLNYLEAKIKSTGEINFINKKDEIIIFRILQEFFSNTIKHARATKLNVEIYSSSNLLTIKVMDNGQGFDVNKIASNGIGLENIKNRAKLIHADLEITSEKGVGTKLLINYQYNLKYKVYDEKKI